MKDEQDIRDIQKLHKDDKDRQKVTDVGQDGKIKQLKNIGNLEGIINGLFTPVGATDAIPDLKTLMKPGSTTVTKYVMANVNAKVGDVIAKVTVDFVDTIPKDHGWFFVKTATTNEYQLWKFTAPKYTLDGAGAATITAEASWENLGIINFVVPSYADYTLKPGDAGYDATPGAAGQFIKGVTVDTISNPYSGIYIRTNFVSKPDLQAFGTETDKKN